MKTSEKVLDILARKQQILSGQKIADELNISRSAVWKVIQNLEASGFDIVTHQGLGYELFDSNKLSVALIKRYLPKDLRNIEIEFHEEINSTNIRAKELSSDSNIKTPYIIVANQQTSAYGRYGRHFDTQNDLGIYVSILISNKDHSFNPGLLTTATSVAMTRTIEEKLHVVPEIKWVNDIIVDGKKVCGILTEGVADLETDSIKSIIIGSGINYLTEKFPDEIKNRAGSLRKYALKNNISRNEFLATYLTEFFRMYSSYENRSFMEEYCNHSNVIGEKVTITRGPKQISGIVTKINNDGAIVLDSGEVLSSGEVTKIRVKK